MKTGQLVSLGLVAAASAACGGGTAQLATKQPAPKAPAGNVVNAGAKSTPERCATGNLSVHLGAAGGAAGSTYEPLVFTNTGSATCTLDGYPGVAFVAPQSGKQVGAAASRNPQRAASLVTLAPGASASAMLQIANYANYPASSCSPTSVSGLRIYPPGSTTAKYVAFAQIQQACSTKVNQLTVQAVVAGASGM